MMTKARYPATAGACSIALLLSPTPAAAQDQSSPAPATLPAASKPAASAGGDAAAEIIVTARKVGENLQRTPVAVSAISGELLERQSLVQLEDLSNVVPNLQLTTSSASGTGALVYIRGVGSNSSSLYADSPVAVYVDGVLLPHGAALSFDLPDLDHIEVLRGPQGTLFGRNTTGGAVNLFTSQPTEQASAKLMASYGTDNDINANAVLNSGEIAPGLLSVYGGWRAPFAIYLLGAIFFLCALVTLDRRMDAVGGRPDQVGESLRPLIPLYILTYVLFLVVMMTAIQVPILLAGVGITNPATRSLMLSLGSIGSSTSGFLFGWIFRALGPRWTMVFSPALVALGFIVAGSSLDPRIVAGACLTFGFGAGMTNPYICNLMLSRAAPALRARAVGLIFVVASVAEFSNPLLIAPLQNAIGIRGAFLAVGIMVGIGAAANALIQIRRNMGS